MFESLLIHTCTIQKFVQSTATTGSYGHKSTLVSTPQTVLATTACRMRPLSAQELTALAQANTVIASHMLYIPYYALPDGMTALLGPTQYQVVDVRRRTTGVLIDTGPFDIEDVTDAAGEGHHIQMRLKRVG